MCSHCKDKNLTPITQQTLAEIYRAQLSGRNLGASWLQLKVFRFSHQQKDCSEKHGKLVTSDKITI